MSDNENDNEIYSSEAENEISENELSGLSSLITGYNDE